MFSGSGIYFLFTWGWGYPIFIKGAIVGEYEIAREVDGSVHGPLQIQIYNSVKEHTMKVQVIYSSLTGCTKKIADAIYSGLSVEQKTIHDLKDGVPQLDGDIILLGYWGNCGNPNDEMKAFLQTIKGKAVGIFCTLGYYADSAHARQTLEAGLNLVKDNNEMIGAFVCNGAVANKPAATQGQSSVPTPTEQKEIRWEMIRNHPTAAECALAAERFRERIALYSRCKELNITFTSVL